MLKLLLLLTFVHVSWPPFAAAMTDPQPITVIADGRVIHIEDALIDGQFLWVTAKHVFEITRFEPKPQGFCSADLCIPIPDSEDWVKMQNGQSYYCMTRFAEKIEQAMVVHASRNVWSFGSIPMHQRSLLREARAPDFALSDREGHMVRLADFRGKKVLLLTWASW